MSKKVKQIIVGILLIALGLGILAYNKSRVAVGAINYNFSHVVVGLALLIALGGLIAIILSFIGKSTVEPAKE
jgi:hypothetical protein